MGRRSGFAGLINQIAREQARSQRRQIAEHNRQVRDYNRMLREQERDARSYEREQKQYEKELRLQYLEDRQQETDDLNEQLNERIIELKSLLEHTLEVDDEIDFEDLKIRDNFPAFQIPLELSRIKPEPNRANYQIKTPVKTVRFLEKIFHGKEGKDNRLATQEQKDIEASENAYKNALAMWQNGEKERAAKIQALRNKYEAERKDFVAKMTERNAEVEELKKAYNESEPEAVVTYNVMVLERSEYPEGFPQDFRVGFSPESKELIVDYELPDVNIVPKEAEYKFVKTKDEIQSKPRKSTEIKTIYQDIVASLCLRTLHEVFEADQQNNLSVVTFNGFVQTVDRTTGRDIRPYLTSVRVTKDRFLEIDLSRIDKKSCLRNLGAQVSPQPDECVPVKPVVEFNMVDRRFVEGSDVLSELDIRPNLMELNPFEFENLVGNLFTQMGLDSRQTQTSRDGGVDVVAYDTRPVFGGKVVIQAKRYKNTVGVAAVRDLYGTMINEGASKGILVATSGYGKDAFEFAKDKPIELIDGGGLLYLLEQHANIRAKIIMPQE